MFKHTIKTRARLSLLALTAIMISVPVWAGVTVTSPGTTCASPAHFVASASSNYPITAMRIYVDNTTAYTVSANKIDTYLGMAAGPHYVVVQAWDTTGAVFKSASNLTVSATASTASGVTVNSPAPGSTTGSPIHFAASARAAHPIAAMRVYLDNNSVYTAVASSIDTYVNASAGAHYAVVQAWDTTGAVYKSAVNLTVSGAASTSGASGVTVSSPANGGTSGSSIHFVASAHASNPIAAMRIYLDNNSVYTNASSSLDTYVNASAGSHYAVVQAWDSKGAVYKSALNINVAGTASPSPAPSAPSGAQYYVSPSGSDSNSGSASSPWKTLTHAGSSVGAGATVHVAPGTYSSSSEMKLTASGTSSARVVFVSDTKWGAKVVGGATGNATAIWITGNYVDFVGFDVTGSGAMGIYIYGSNDRIIGNHVHNIAASGCPAGAGILNGNYNGGHDVDIIGNVVNDIGTYNQPCSLLHGIYTTNPGGHIWNNIVFRNQGWGIHTWHAATQNNISNNTVVNNGYGGIIVGAGDGSWVNSGTVVSNNVVYQNGLFSGSGGNGIEEYGNTGSNTFVDNLVYGNGPKDWSLQNGDSTSGSLTGNPMFTSYTQYSTTNDYHVQSSSPALGKGSSSYGPTYDHAGASRPAASITLGAYQYGTTAAGWPYMY